MRILVCSTLIWITINFSFPLLYAEELTDSSDELSSDIGKVAEDESQFQINIIRALLTRHPKIMINNLYFKRNFVEITQKLWDLKKKLDLTSLNEDYTNDTELFFIKFKEASFHLSNNLRFRNFENRIHNARKNLEKNYGEAFFRRQRFEDFFLDLEINKNLALGKDLLLLAPLILDQEGRMILYRNWHDVDVAFKGMGLEGFLEKYSTAAIDFWKLNWTSDNTKINSFIEVLVDYLKEKIFQKELRSVKDFLASKVVNSSQGETLRSLGLSLEKMPSILSVFRNFGEDCVLRSVALFALAADAEVYMVRKSSQEDSQPVAYVFILNVRVNDKFFPYVLTINGDVDINEVNWILDMIGEIKQVDKLLVSRSPFDLKLVNSKVTSEQMLFGSFDLEEDERVMFGEDWKTIEKESEKFKYASLDVYYSQNNIAEVKWRPTRKLDDRNIVLEKRVLHRPYLQSQKIEKSPLVDRAILAAQMLPKVSVFLRDRIQNSLGVTSEQVDVMFKFAKFDRQKLIHEEDFSDMQRELNFTAKDLLNYDDVYAAETLSRLYVLNSISEEDFLEVGEIIYKTLARRMRQAKEMHFHPSIYMDLFQAQIALATGLRRYRSELVDESMFTTSLLYASQNSHNWVVEHLIQAGEINANFVLPNHTTLLQTAAFWGNLSLVRFLVEKGAKLSKQGVQDKWHALRLSVVSAYNERNRFEMTEFLLQHEDVKKISHYEFQKLISLVSHRDVELRELLGSFFEKNYGNSFWGKCRILFKLYH